jgi:hypothetical protein
LFCIKIHPLDLCLCRGVLGDQSDAAGNNKRCQASVQHLRATDKPKVIVALVPDNCHPHNKLQDDSDMQRHQAVEPQSVIQTCRK